MTVALGQVMRLAGGLSAEESVERMRRVEGLAVVSASWLLIAHLAALPYVWAGLGPIDALFEAMSGLTTTGATIFRDFSLYGRGIFFWRSFTQWLGGMGVIALFVAVLPRLAIGGRELFFAEAPGPERREGEPADSPNGRGAMEALRRAHRAPGRRALARRLQPVRRRLPRVHDARGRRLLAAPALD